MVQYSKDTYVKKTKTLWLQMSLSLAYDNSAKNTLSASCVTPSCKRPLPLVLLLLLLLLLLVVVVVHNGRRRRRLQRGNTWYRAETCNKLASNMHQ
jgi:hypothetical protein